MQLYSVDTWVSALNSETNLIYMTEDTAILKDNKHEQVLREWLTKFKSLPKSSIEKYGYEMQHDTLIHSSLDVALLTESNSVLLELLQPICHQLFDFYRTE